jgi:NAD(P)-dependent dehydrogenase (short-subunit alcohol dehydrogenase family)
MSILWAHFIPFVPKVNIASTSGIRANRAAPVYSASKHAVVGLTKSVARDVAHRSVRINAIAPGFVATPMVKVHLTPERISQTSLASRPADPLEIARVVSFLLGDDASFVTAAVWPVDAGHSAGP